MVSKLKNTWRFFGGMNVYCDVKNESAVISKVNRRIRGFYLGNIFLSVLILVCIVVLIESLFGMASVLLLYYSFIILGFSLLLYFLARIKEGDTIIATEDGIMEINWLFSKYIKWSDVVKVYFYSGGNYLKNLPVLKEIDYTWTNIKIKGHNQTIRVNTAYSNNEQLKEYIKMRCSGKIKEKGFNLLRLLIGLIVGILGAVFLLKLRELIK